MISSAEMTKMGERHWRFEDTEDVKYVGEQVSEGTGGYRKGTVRTKASPTCASEFKVRSVHTRVLFRAMTSDPPAQTQSCI